MREGGEVAHVKGSGLLGSVEEKKRKERKKERKD